MAYSFGTNCHVEYRFTTNDTCSVTLDLSVSGTGNLGDPPSVIDCQPNPYNFYPCSRAWTYTFPSYLPVCNGITLDIGVSGAGDVTTPVSYTEGLAGYVARDSFGNHCQPEYHFTQPLTLDLSVSGTGELPDLSSPAGDGYLTLDLSVSGTGEYVDAGNADITLDLDVSGTATIGTRGDGYTFLDIAVSGTGTLPVVGQSDLTLDLDVSGTGDMPMVIFGTGDITLDIEVSAEGEGATNEGVCNVTLDDFIVYAEGSTVQYSVNVILNTRCNNSKEAIPTTIILCDNSQDTLRHIVSRCDDSQESSLTRQAICDSSQEARPIKTAYHDDSQESVPKSVPYCDDSQEAIPVITSRCDDSQESIVATTSRCDDSQEAMRLSISRCDNSQDINKLVQALHRAYNEQPWIFEFGSSCNREYSFTNSLYQELTASFVGAVVHAVCDTNTSQDSTAITRCDDSQECIAPPQGNGTPPPEVIDPPPIVDTTRLDLHYPIKDMHMIKNTYSATFADGTAVNLGSVNLTYSPTQTAWNANATITSEDEIDKVKAHRDELLTININGVDWVVLIDQLNETHSFNSKVCQLTAGGLSVQLSVPFQLKRSYLFESDMTVGQIVRNILPLDWDIVWQGADWNVPADTVSLIDVSPMEAISRVLSDTKHWLVPHRTEKKITIVKQSSVLAWQRATTTPDITITDNPVFTAQYGDDSQTDVNGVFVHGSSTNAVLGKVMLNGTQGANLASTVGNQLVTTGTAVTHIGEQVLSRYVDVPAIRGFTTQMCPADGFELFETGMFVDVIGERGCVNSVTVTAEFNKVRQSVTLESNDANAFSRFDGLIARSPVLLGQVLSSTGNSSKVDLVGSGTIQVNGGASVGSYVYVRDGAIVNTVPNGVYVLSDTVIG